MLLTVCTSNQNTIRENSWLVSFYWLSENMNSSTCFFQTSFFRYKPIQTLLFGHCLEDWLIRKSQYQWKTVKCHLQRVLLLNYQEGQLCKLNIVVDPVLNLVGLRIWLINLIVHHWKLPFHISYSESFGKD